MAQYYPMKVKALHNTILQWLTIYDSKTNKYNVANGVVIKKDDVMIIASSDYKSYQSSFEILEAPEQFLKNQAVEKANFLTEKNAENEERHQKQVEVYESRIKQLENDKVNGLNLIQKLQEKIMELELELANKEAFINNAATMSATDESINEDDLPTQPTKGRGRPAAK